MPYLRGALKGNTILENQFWVAGGRPDGSVLSKVWQKQLAEDFVIRSKPSVSSRAKATARRILPAPIIRGLGFLKRFICDIPVMVRFLYTKHDSITFLSKVRFLIKILNIDLNIECAHSNTDILVFCDKILCVATWPRDGVVVEAGCYKGGSTAKFSIACAMARKQLIVFDSFQGIPENSESHSLSIFGNSVRFSQGDYRGTLAEVKKNIENFGNISTCTFIEGFFSETLTKFATPVLAAYLDVDLVSSTRDCVRFLYPRIVEGGWLFSQDGHLPLVLELLGDETFWRKDVGCTKPEIVGFGKRKVIWMQKGERCTGTSTSGYER
jgi:O-methyltransferase